jgi:hypothetical protein
MNDRPYTEIVTADYMVANHVTATVWGTSYDTEGPEWQVSQFLDGRPVAGVLSDPWLFTRHSSTPSNANRGRANALSNALLCYDFLDRDIEIDSSINLADPDVVTTAVVDNDACAACHQVLDPLAAFFGDYFPLYVASNIEAYPFSEFYSPNIFENIGIAMRPPSYFGQSGANVVDLGHMMAADPRMSLCAAQRFYAYFNQIALDEVPFIAMAELQKAFIQSGLNAKALAKAIVLDEAFGASHTGDALEAETLPAVKKIRPDQLATTFYDLTGFVWATQLDVPDIEIGRVELMRDSFLGFQVLGGGIDGAYVTRPSHTYNATAALLLQTIAAEAATFVVGRDFSQPDPAQRHLLRLVAPDVIDPATAREQIAWLHQRIFGDMVDAQSAAVDESWELFSAAFQHSGNIARSWELLLTAMLQDIRIATY